VAASGFLWRATENDYTASNCFSTIFWNSYGLRLHTEGATTNDIPLMISSGAAPGTQKLLWKEMAPSVSEPQAPHLNCKWAAYFKWASLTPTNATMNLDISAGIIFNPECICLRRQSITLPKCSGWRFFIIYDACDKLIRAHVFLWKRWHYSCKIQAGATGRTPASVTCRIHNCFCWHKHWLWWNGRQTWNNKLLGPSYVGLICDLVVS